METIEETQSDLLKMKKLLEDDIQEKKDKLASLPDIDKTEREAERIRLGLMDYFGTVEAFKEHGYRHKREFMHWMFDGNDEDGFPYGIYLTKRGEKWDYTISAKMIFGTRTLFGNDIDYWDEETSDMVKKNINNLFKSNRNRHDVSGPTR